MFLTIDQITGARRDGDTVRVTVHHQMYCEAAWLHVDISRDSVTVSKVPGDAMARSSLDLATVLVSPELVDATRRLFGLVGVA